MESRRPRRWPIVGEQWGSARPANLWSCGPRNRNGPVANRAFVIREGFEHAFRAERGEIPFERGDLGKFRNTENGAMPCWVRGLNWKLTTGSGSHTIKSSESQS